MKVWHVMQKSQRGFTLVELLVVIAVTSALLSLLLPALNRAKETGRSAVCRNNMHQIMLAVEYYVLDNEDYLPWPGAVDRNLAPDWVFGGFNAKVPPDPKEWAQVGYATHAESGSLFTYITSEPRMVYNDRTTNSYPQYRCPSSGLVGRARRVTYGMNARFDPQEELAIKGPGLQKSEIVRPTQKVIMVDASADTANCGAFYPWGSANQSQMQPHNERVNMGFVDNHMEVLRYQRLIENQQTHPTMSRYFEPFSP